MSAGCDPGWVPALPLSSRLCHCFSPSAAFLLFFSFPDMKEERSTLQGDGGS